MHMALEAAEKLEEGKISAEVIDLRSVKPLDTDTVINSVSIHRICCRAGGCRQEANS